MRLDELKISNFRGLKGNNNIIKFSGANIIFLIGQNNVGKSTYLRAYEYFVSSKQNALITDFYDSNNDHPIIIEGTFTIEEGDDANTDFNKKNKEPEWISKWATDGVIVKVRKKWDHPNGSFKKQTFDPQTEEWVDNGFGGMDSLFTRYAPTPISINAMETEQSLKEKVNKLIQDKHLKTIQKEQGELCQEIKDKIYELQTNIAGAESTSRWNEELNQQFSKTFEDLVLSIQPDRDDNIKLEDAFKKNHTISVTNKTNNQESTFLQCGHGVIRQALFSFLTFLDKFKEGNQKEYIILYEEPELFLHPKVTFKLRQSLYDLAENSPYQILCATHSPMMIDISKPHSTLVRITRENDFSTVTTQVGDDVFQKDEETKQRVQMINRFNPHICEVFYADKVLLVEGDTETIVYRDLLHRFFPNEEVYVLNTGSKNNIPFFQEVLTHFEIEHYAIHDVDSRLRKDGKKNSAWAFNDKIWQGILKANEKKDGLARRYVHFRNFEGAHSIKLAGGKDKPLSAYQFLQKITDNMSDKPDCLRWLIDICGDQSIVHDQAYINALDPEENLVDSHDL